MGREEDGDRLRQEDGLFFFHFCLGFFSPTLRFSRLQKVFFSFFSNYFKPPATFSSARGKCGVGGDIREIREGERAQPLLRGERERELERNRARGGGDESAGFFGEP